MMLASCEANVIHLAVRDAYRIGPIKAKSFHFGNTASRFAIDIKLGFVCWSSI